MRRRTAERAGEEDGGADQVGCKDCLCMEGGLECGKEGADGSREYGLSEWKCFMH